jgi:hypothetical protein
MILHRHHFVNIFFEKTILISLFITFFFTIPYNDVTALESETISIDVKETPLNEIFKLISADTGYEIKINEKWAERPITIKLEDIAVEPGLKRIMNSLKMRDVAIVTDKEKKTIEILIFYSDSGNVKKGANHKGYSTNNKQKAERLNKNGDGITVSGNFIDTPPSESGEPGMTVKELKAIEELQINIPDDLTGAPPSESGEPGMTVEELKAIEELQINIPDDLTETPPPELGI